MLRDSSDKGFTLVEVVVGMALLSLVVGAILLVFRAGWKAEVKAYSDSRVQAVARETMSRIVYGDPRVTPRVRGLLQAYAVVTDPARNAIAYKTIWQDDSGTEHKEVVTYYLSDGKLYRSVTPYNESLGLVIVTEGGTVVAEWISGFTLSANGVLPVEITLEVTQPRGTSMMLQTKVQPRNLGGG